MEYLNNIPLTIRGDGNQKRDFTYVGDVVRANLLASQYANIKPGEIFNIGQTEEISIKNLAEMIIKETDSKSEIIFKTHKEVYGERFEDPMRRTPSIKKIVDATDYSPTMTIPEMIKEIIDYKKLNS